MNVIIMNYSSNVLYNNYSKTNLRYCKSIKYCNKIRPKRRSDLRDQRSNHQFLLKNCEAQRVEFSFRRLFEILFRCMNENENGMEMNDMKENVTTR